MFRNRTGTLAAMSNFTAYGLRIYDDDVLSVEDAYDAVFPYVEPEPEPDTTSPRVVDLSHPVGQPVAGNETLSFTLVDPGLVAVVISDGRGGTVYDSVEFYPRYRNSVVTETTYEGEYALRFDIRPVGGWTGPRVLHIRAV